MYKNGQHKEMFVSDIGLCVHNLIINLSSMVNKIGGGGRGAEG